MDPSSLREVARRLRIAVIDMIWKAGTGHPGGSLSLAEIMAVLYFDKLRIVPQNPLWPDRDRLVLSKGHAAPLLYAALAERGFFPRATLDTLRQSGSLLQGHPDMTKTPGVDMTTGCLGEGLSAAVGLALAARLDRRSYTVYALLSDGELMEGQTWEAALFAGAQCIDGLVAIVDENGCMCDDHIEDVIPLGSLSAKWEAFGWKTLAIDGHNVEQIGWAIDVARTYTQGPVAILARCVKGKGVSFMEDNPSWHGQIMKASEYRQAMAELGGEPHCG